MRTAQLTFDSLSPLKVFIDRNAWGKVWHIADLNHWSPAETKVFYHSPEEAIADARRLGYVVVESRRNPVPLSPTPPVQVAESGREQ
jgi:hypothetical protein